MHHAHTFILGNLNPELKSLVRGGEGQKWYIHKIGEDTYEYVFTINIVNN